MVGNYTLTGRIATGEPLEGLIVRAYDKDPKTPANPLGREAVTYAEGRQYKISFTERAYKVVTSADVLAEYTGSITDAVRRDMQDRNLLALYEAQDSRGDLRRETAARPAQRQENRKGE